MSEHTLKMKRQNPFAFTRTNHTGENIPTEMATGYYREFMKTTFPENGKRVDFKYSSETFFVTQLGCEKQNH